VFEFNQGQCVDAADIIIFKLEYPLLYDLQLTALQGEKRCISGTCPVFEFNQGQCVDAADISILTFYDDLTNKDVYQAHAPCMNLTRDNA
jgi:hypothetical protein